MRADGRWLRRYVVRVQAGASWGSGVFVAPGWVLTCAHVVAGQQRVQVVPDGWVDGAGVAADVVVASPAPSGGGALWPFPDLALLRLTVEVPHMVAPLDPRGPAGGQCHTWGYAVREAGLPPVGSPSSFEIEGDEGDGFVRLKAGQASPGLSGAPLVCPVRRAVVGLVAATRDMDGDLGGWASPVDAFLHGGAGVPEDMAVHGEQLRELNRRAAVTDRVAWSRVLPVAAEGLLEQPWAEFVRGPRTSPSELLRADFGVVPYLFRDQALHDLTSWCERVEPMLITQVAGLGGAGKTRFAIEACKRLTDAGWLTGLWRPGTPGAAGIAVPRLIMVDYVEAADIEQLRVELAGLRAGASEMAPVRVVLLTRTTGGRVIDPVDELTDHAPASLRTVLNATTVRAEAVATLTGGQRHALYTQAHARFLNAWHPASDSAEAGQIGVDLSDGRYALPLEVLFEAFDRALSGPDWQTHNGLPPVARALAHEAVYWNATAARDTPDLPVALRRTAVALATLAGAADDAEAEALLALLPGLDTETTIRRHTARWLAGMYPGPGQLNPLRPDRLGE